MNTESSIFKVKRIYHAGLGWVVFCLFAAFTVWSLLNPPAPGWTTAVFIACALLGALYALSNTGNAYCLDNKGLSRVTRWGSHQIAAWDDVKRINFSERNEVLLLAMTSGGTAALRCGELEEIDDFIHEVDRYLSRSLYQMLETGAASTESDQTESPAGTTLQFTRSCGCCRSDSGPPPLPHFPHAGYGADVVQWSDFTDHLPATDEEQWQLSDILPVSGTERVVRVKYPFAGAVGCRFRTLYKPALSAYNGWDESADEINTSAFIECQLLELLSVSDKAAWIKILVTDVIMLADAVNCISEDKEIPRFLDSFDPEVLEVSEFNSWHLLTCNYQGDFGKWALITTAGEKPHLVLYGCWSSSEDFAWIGNLVLSVPSVLLAIHGSRYAEISQLVEQSEQAFTRMYESGTPKDDRDDALLHLAKAIDMAKELGIDQEAARLKAQYEHINAVFNSQFRWR